jgi:G3E family GTPase
MTDSSTLPLVIVTGDLGAGKTSGLRLVSEQFGFRKPHMLVNEAGAAVVEVGAFGLAAGGPVSLVGGGCACCEKSKELVDALNEIVQDPDRGCDAILLEASGLADPAAIVRVVLGHLRLSNHLRIHSLVHVVDATGVESWDEIAHSRAVALADVCIVSKADLLGEEDFRQVLASISKANFMSTVFSQSRTDDGIVLTPMSSPSGRDRVQLSQRLASLETHDAQTTHHPSGDVQTVAITLPEGASWLALMTWLGAVLPVWGDRILRVKGAVLSRAGWVAVNAVNHTLYPPEFSSHEVESSGRLGQLIVIGRDIPHDELIRSARLFVDERITEQRASIAIGVL